MKRSPRYAAATSDCCGPVRLEVKNNIALVVQYLGVLKVNLWDDRGIS